MTDATGERYGPLVHRSVHHGAALWLAGVVVFVAGMAVSQLGWTTPYSLTQNYISDLGAVRCGTYAGRYVCSPWHQVFNLSIIVMGVLLIVGVLLLPSAFPSRGSRRVGLGMLVLTGIGAIGVGIFPEDVNLNAHLASVLIAFLLGNLALIVLGFAMFRDTRWDGWRGYSILSGLFGLVCFGLILGKAYRWGGFWHDWGAGGIERAIAAPILLWALLVSIHLLRIPSFAPRHLPRPTAT